MSEKAASFFIGFSCFVNRAIQNRSKNNSDGKLLYICFCRIIILSKNINDDKDKAPQAIVGNFNNRQLLYVRYFTAILIDLLVLNFFDEYWDNVVIESFTISVFVAILLQVMLKFTIKIEHIVGDYFNSKPGKFMKFMRYFSAWAILFVSKLIILEAVNMAFGDEVKFKGAWHGVVAFIVVVMVMLVAEMFAAGINKKLGKIG